MTAEHLKTGVYYVKKASDSGIEYIASLVIKWRVFRRLSLILSWVIAFRATEWAMDFVEQNQNAGMEGAAMISAIMLPVFGLAGAIIKFQTQHRYNGAAGVSGKTDE